MPGTSVLTRPVRQLIIDTGRPFAEFRAAYERLVPSFDRLEAIGVVLSGSGWEAIARLSEATATHGLVNFFTFDPSPVMALNGHTGHGVTYLAGNIAHAEPGFGRLPDCFLYIPLRVVIASDGEQDARMRIDHPGDLFAAFGDPELDAVAADFTGTLISVLELLEAPVPPELAA
jgi:uncharacterized protein (DUF302 family)